MKLVALVLALAACRETPKPRDLADYLYTLSGRADRATEIATWKLTGDEWDRVVVEPYRGLYEQYAAHFDAARPTFVTQLARSHSILSRAHFAGDPLMTHDQAITRWALPTLAKARIAELAGRPPAAIDAVFVELDGHWKAIVGLGAIVRARVAALDPVCAGALDGIDPAGGHCIEAAWQVADAALREDRARFTHACGLAANVCGKRSP